MAKQNIVGPNIRRLRVQEGLAQEDLAARCGVAGWHVTRSTIAKIESQVRCVTDAELCILAAALRCPAASLLAASRREIVAQLKQADAS